MTAASTQRQCSIGRGSAYALSKPLDPAPTATATPASPHLRDHPTRTVAQLGPSSDGQRFPQRGRTLTARALSHDLHPPCLVSRTPAEADRLSGNGSAPAATVPTSVQAERLLMKYLALTGHPQFVWYVADLHGHFGGPEWPVVCGDGGPPWRLSIRSDRPADLADEAVALTSLVPLREWWPGPSMALLPASEPGTLGKPIQVGRDAVDVSENVGRSDRGMPQAEAT
jgi:hypothetical protein